MPETYTAKELADIYAEGTRLVTARCHFLTRCVGGQPASEGGIRAFAEFHLKLAGPELDAAVKRIMDEEIGEKDATPETGEVKERESFGVNVVRHCPACRGPYLGNWMVKACLKCAASRLGLFAAKGKIGSKGDLAEFGSVTDLSAQTQPTCSPFHVHVYAADGKTPATTYYDRFSGRVNTPQGAKSIVHDSECLPVGATFGIKLRVPRTRLTDEDLARVFAFAQNVGLGSAKALECGKFEIDELVVGA